MKKNCLFCFFLLVSGCSTDCGEHPGGGMMGKRGGMMGRMNPGMRKGKMMQGMMMPGTGIKSEQLPDKNSAAAKKYTGYCGQCHLLQDPGMKSARQWPGIVERMDDRMRRMASMGMMPMMRGRMKAMTGQDKKKIIAYLQKHSLRAVAPGSIKGLTGKGSKEFKSVCSRCHDLPDPGQHTTGEWKTVIQRMKKNISLMGKQTITPAEEKLIFEFLKDYVSN